MIAILILPVFKKIRSILIFLYIFENVDKFKNYDINIKFTVEKLPQAKAEIDSLEQSQKDMLEADYKKNTRTRN